MVSPSSRRLRGTGAADKDKGNEGRDEGRERGTCVEKSPALALSKFHLLGHKFSFLVAGQERDVLASLHRHQTLCSSRGGRGGGRGAENRICQRSLDELSGARGDKDSVEERGILCLLESFRRRPDHREDLEGGK
jgi:hypothetical protein